jgi:hypothetical protein
MCPACLANIAFLIISTSGLSAAAVKRFRGNRGKKRISPASDVKENRQ